MKRYCPEQTPIFLIGTKSDLQTRRMVSHEMIKAFVDKSQVSYLETSSKTNENVEKCFVDFTQALVTYTNQIQMSFKNVQKQKPIVDLNDKRKTIGSKQGSGCLGRDTCTI